MMNRAIRALLINTQQKDSLLSDKYNDPDIQTTHFSASKQKMKYSLDIHFISFKIIIFIFSFLFSSVECSFKRVCYLTIDHSPFNGMSGSVFDKGNLLESFDANYCTHINVMPVLADGNNCALRVQYEKDIAIFQDIQRLRQMNSNIKILVTVLENGITDMSLISSTEENRQKFAKNAVDFMTKYNFDGLDLDWEFPVWTSMRMKEKNDFIFLLKELHHHFKKNTTKELLLTAAVAGDFTIISPSYDVPPMNEYLDYINLMTYAFNNWYWYWPFTGHNAPIFGSRTDYFYFSRINMAHAANYWHELGMSKDKIIIGVPTYTHTFYLVFSFLHGVHAPARKGGVGTSFAAVCQFLNQTGSHKEWDDYALVPYAYNQTFWITYEDNISAKLKAEWIKDHGFGGYMTYNLNNDDYEGLCVGEAFPIHKVLYQVLN